MIKLQCLSRNISSLLHGQRHAYLAHSRRLLIPPLSPRKALQRCCSKREVTQPAIQCLTPQDSSNVTQEGLPRGCSKSEVTQPLTQTPLDTTSPITSMPSPISHTLHPFRVLSPTYTHSLPPPIPFLPLPSPKPHWIPLHPLPACLHPLQTPYIHS